jgi:hypothetical protein
MAHLTMIFIFYVDVIICKNFNLLQIYHIFAKKLILWNEFFLISHIVFKHGSYYVKWHGSIYFQLS